MCIVMSGTTNRMDLDGQVGIETCVDNVLLDGRRWSGLPSFDASLPFQQPKCLRGRVEIRFKFCLLAASTVVCGASRDLLSSETLDEEPARN